MRGLMSKLFVVFLSVLIAFGPEISYAQALFMPEPGTVTSAGAAFVPVIMKGMTIHPENPLAFDFVIDTGNTGLKAGTDDQALREHTDKLVKYFLASLALPDQDQWVNLSPYEKDRMLPEALGQTLLGRDMLAQDYVLKQITSSLMHPDQELGQAFWARVYERAQKEFATTNIPVDVFNKVWIAADKADVYVKNNTAFIAAAHLKVMLESDYKAAQIDSQNSPQDISKQLIREVILPELEKEVNTAEAFASLRQIFYSMILATWYKKNLKEALLNQVYSNQNKTVGMEWRTTEDANLSPESVWQKYEEAYKKGAFNFIREDVDPSTGEAVARKYMSGGIEPSLNLPEVGTVVETITPSATVPSGDFVLSSLRIDVKKANAHDTALPQWPAVRATRIKNVVGSLRDLALEGAFRDIAEGKPVARAGVEEVFLRNGFLLNADNVKDVLKQLDASQVNDALRMLELKHQAQRYMDALPLDREWYLKPRVQEVARAILAADLRDQLNKLADGVIAVDSQEAQHVHKVFLQNRLLMTRETVDMVVKSLKSIDQAETASLSWSEWSKQVRRKLTDEAWRVFFGTDTYQELDRQLTTPAAVKAFQDFVLDHDQQISSKAMAEIVFSSALLFNKAGGNVASHVMTIVFERQLKLDRFEKLAAAVIRLSGTPRAMDMLHEIQNSSRLPMNPIIKKYLATSSDKAQKQLVQMFRGDFYFTDLFEGRAVSLILDKNALTENKTSEEAVFSYGVFLDDKAVGSIPLTLNVGDVVSVGAISVRGSYPGLQQFIAKNLKPLRKKRSDAAMSPEAWSVWGQRVEATFKDHNMVRLLSGSDAYQYFKDTFTSAESIAAFQEFILRYDQNITGETIAETVLILAPLFNVFEASLAAGVVRKIFDKPASDEARYGYKAFSILEHAVREMQEGKAVEMLQEISNSPREGMMLIIDKYLKNNTIFYKRVIDEGAVVMTAEYLKWLDSSRLTNGYSLIRNRSRNPDALYFRCAFFVNHLSVTETNIKTVIRYMVLNVKELARSHKKQGDDAQINAALQGYWGENRLDRFGWLIARDMNGKPQNYWLKFRLPVDQDSEEFKYNQQLISNGVKDGQLIYEVLFEPKVGENNTKYSDKNDVKSKYHRGYVRITFKEGKIVGWGDLSLKQKNDVESKNNLRLRGEIEERLAALLPPAHVDQSMAVRKDADKAERLVVRINIPEDSGDLTVRDLVRDGLQERGISLEGFEDYDIVIQEMGWNGNSLRGHRFDKTGKYRYIEKTRLSVDRPLSGLNLKKGSFIVFEGPKTEPTVSGDKAAINGGIDLNGSKMHMTEQGEQIQMSVDPAMIERFRSGDFTGVRPVILQIKALPAVSVLFE